MRPRPQTRPETCIKVPIRRFTDGATPPEETPEGWVFFTGRDSQSPYTGFLCSGWFVDPPPGVRARVVEILKNVNDGIRVQGPVVVSKPKQDSLWVHVDSALPLASKRPLFLLVFEQDFRTNAHCID